MTKTGLLRALIPLIVVTAALTAAPQPAAQAGDFPALAARLEAAVLADDAAGVKAARLECLRWLAASPAPAPDRAALLRYTVAYAAWRVAFTPALDTQEQITLLDDAKVQLEAVVAANPQHAEAMGLLAAVLGAKIAKSPDLGMTLGPASGEMLGRAFRIEPANPRLFVMRGQSLFNTPPEYGGSVGEAETVFRRALQLFDQEPASKPWPNWGRFDAHVWLGQALAARRDKAGARAEYEKALVLAPKSNWVRLTLLPAVK